MKRVVITINRQYGSGGKTIGYMLAEKLGIPCYSREILQRASEEVVLMRVCSMHEMNAWKGYRNSCYPPTYIAENSFHRKAKNLHQIRISLTTKLRSLKIRSRRFLRIDRTMRWLCLKRRSGYDQRIRSCRSRFPDESALERVSMSEKEMEKYIERTNKYRSDFYHYHTGRSWDDAENYDLCINSGKLGLRRQ